MDSAQPAVEAPAAEAPAPSVSSLPDAKPIDSTVPSSSSTTPKKPSPSSSTLGALLKATPSAVDAFIARLQRCLQSRGDADVVLFFLCYLTRLSGAVLEDVSRATLKSSAQRLIDLAAKLPPSTTVTLSGPVGGTTGAVLAAGALRLAGRLKAFSGLLTEVRTFGRLWGLIGLYFAAKRLVLSRLAPKNDSISEKQTSSSTFSTLLSIAQITSLISFQATENIAFLASKKVLLLPPATTGRIARWSVRSWMCYVYMEVGRHLLERGQRVSAARAKGTTVKQEDAEWDATWKRDFFRNLAWAPLTVHWAVDNGPLSELAISLLAFYPACGQIRDLWRAKA